MPRLPDRADYVIIGAGIHGLSTSMHLAQKLKAKGKVVGAGGVRIVVLDKTGIGAGASGIACGVVRNNYYQPAMRELMAHSVAVWESDAAGYSYHPVGYMQISPEVMHAQVATIYEQQRAIGYDSTFIEGEAESLRYMRGMFHDWQAKNITSVLHEKRGGYANNQASLAGLERKTRALGVDIIAGVKVTGFRSEGGSGAITAVETDAGTIACGQFDLEHAGAAEGDHGQGARRHDARRRAHVALHGAAGRHARGRSGLPEDQRRRDAARDTRRYRRTALLRP